MASSSTTHRNTSRYEARPCRVGGGVAPFRHAVRAAFNFPTTMANTGCMKRQCVCESLNGSQVRRGSLIGSPSALLSAARETRLARLSSAQQSGNLANGGAQTAPGCAAADSLPSQAAPASSIYSAPSGGALQGGNPEGYRRPPHRTSSGPAADAENVRRAVRAIVGCAHLATGAAVCPSPEKRRKGQTRTMQLARALVRARQTRGSAVCKPSKRRTTRPPTRCALPPRDRTGGGNAAGRTQNR